MFRFQKNGVFEVSETIKLSSGRTVYLDSCDHNPKIVKIETPYNGYPGEVGTTESYHWVCAICEKVIAPQIFTEHPCGFTGISREVTE